MDTPRGPPVKLALLLSLLALIILVSMAVSFLAKGKYISIAPNPLHHVSSAPVSEAQTLTHPSLRHILVLSGIALAGIVLATVIGMTLFLVLRPKPIIVESMGLPAAAAPPPDIPETAAADESLVLPPPIQQATSSWVVWMCGILLLSGIFIGAIVHFKKRDILTVYHRIFQGTDDVLPQQ